MKRPVPLTPSLQHTIVAQPEPAHLMALALRLGVRDTRDWAALRLEQMKEQAEEEQ